MLRASDYMKKRICLRNNYVLINSNDKNVKGLDIKTIDWLKIQENKGLLLKIDFDDMEYSEYKNILRNFFKLKRKATKEKINVGVKEDESTNLVVGYLINYDPKNQEQLDFVHALNAIFHKTLYDMYSYIYDVVCYHLDMEFITKNPCNFKEDKCASDFEMGCCYQFKKKFVVCEHMKEKTCTVKCISCKMFTCSYLKKKGFKFKPKEIFLIDTFFGPYQKYILKVSVFLPKETIIKKLLIINREI